MKMKVSDIPDDGLEIDLSVNVDLTGEVSQVVPCKTHLSAYRDDDTVTITGSIDGRVKLSCSRCLEDFQYALHADTHVIYLPEKELLTSKEHQSLMEEELSTASYSEDEIDLPDMIREQVSINIPMKPLCSEKCRGLCTQCGCNLNRSQCSCEGTGTDSRWMKLRTLLKERKG